jgi:phage protein D
VALLNPAYRLTIGNRIVDTTDEPQASIVTDLKVELGMDTPADRFTLVMGQVGSWRPQREDEAAIELGYADDGGLERVMTGVVTTVQPDLVDRRVIGHGAAMSLLRSFADVTFEAKKAGEIVRDLAGRAGVDVAAAEDGIPFPAYVVDGRRSLWRHMRDLADLCGFDLYVDADGELVFQSFSGGRTVHVFDYGRHVIALEIRRTAARAGSVEAWGESPTGSEGDEAWGWLTGDFSGSRGRAGSDEPLLLLERPVLRTSSAAQTAADALHVRLQRRSLRGRLLVLGNPAVRLGDALRVQQAPEEELNGTFQVRSVTHRITKAGGFTTLIGFRDI